MARITALGSARAQVILVVISGMTNKKSIVSKNGRINGREYSCGLRIGGEISSGKLRHVAVKSDQSVSFCNAQQKIQNMHSGYWGRLYGKYF